MRHRVIGVVLGGVMLAAGVAGAQVTAPAPAGPPAATESPRPVVFYGTIDIVALHDSNNSPLGRDQELGAFAFDTTEFSVAPSRLGARFTGDALLGAKPSGRLEFDFLGGGSRTSPRPRLRHAVLTLEWSRHDLAISVGQTTDVIGQLSTDSISFPAESFLGDIGNRRPQVRVTKGVRLSGETKLNLQGSVGITETTIDDAALPDDLKNPSVPIGQGRVAVEWRGNGLGGGVAGAWGSYGSKGLSWASTGERFTMRHWTLGADVRVPLGRRAIVAGEVWRGITMDLYRFAPSMETIRSPGTVLNGGWVALTVRATRVLTANVGVGFERPRVDEADTVRTEPARSWFGNVYYAVNGRFRVGVELSVWSSDRYRSDGVRDKTRVGTEAIYRF